MFLFMYVLAHVEGVLEYSGSLILKAIVKMIDISRASKSEKDDALKESQVAHP